MGCHYLKIGNDIIHVRTSGERRAKSCVHCGVAKAPIQCDFPVGKYKNNRKKTCDRYLCEECASKGVSDNVHFCRQHYPLALAAYHRRTAKQGSLFDAMNPAHLTNRRIKQIFDGSVCRCGARKWERSAFCDDCYDDLSNQVKQHLKRKFGDGFESAYVQACRELDGIKPVNNQ